MNMLTSYLRHVDVFTILEKCNILNIFQNSWNLGNDAKRYAKKRDCACHSVLMENYNYKKVNGYAQPLPCFTFLDVLLFLK